MEQVIIGEGSSRFGADCEAGSSSRSVRSNAHPALSKFSALMLTQHGTLSAELEGTVVKDEPQLSATSRSSSADYVARGPTLSSPPLYSPTVNQAPVLQSDVLSTTDLGFGSVDARLSKPQLAKSLSAHLCDAFFESCCWLLPSFSYYRENLPAYHDDRMELSSSSKVRALFFLPSAPRSKS